MYLLGERSSPLHCGQNPLLSGRLEPAPSARRGFVFPRQSLSPVILALGLPYKCPCLCFSEFILMLPEDKDDGM
ncbi:MAG: hypothetical protein EWV47_14745 [Microcystis viridis Mv_BB_P_19951000_S68]|nr:MAG: hypothetical protein EWV47_14745 [Microcystis viridis Mv_BB_P_19951000_S68]